MSAKKLVVEIVVDSGKEEITVTDDAGNMTALKSVMVIGGGFDKGAFYLVTSGSSSDLGWALGNAFRLSRLSERPEEGHLAKAFNQMVMWIATFFGWGQGENIDPDTLMRRWADEDKARAEREAEEIKYLN